MAAEIQREAGEEGRGRAAASMRPRRMAAEISRPGRRHRPRSEGFNEAAANGRGNPPCARAGCQVPAASMRPRRMAAEIARLNGL